MNAIRLVTLDDVPDLAELFRRNRDFLAPWEPGRETDFFSVEGQRAVVEEALERHEQGLTYPHVILDDSGHIVGRINLGNVVRGLSNRAASATGSASRPTAVASQPPPCATSRSWPSAS
ncbi:MAG: [ribosomal protein S5]-alanine N-acetyltransferase [Pseudonocardiales bacterium]|nr:[ribosomal protein S5]-alanine N-acetyltransferase [Pseudonocardiales bacterium]